MKRPLLLLIAGFFVLVTGGPLAARVAGLEPSEVENRSVRPMPAFRISKFSRPEHFATEWMPYLREQLPFRNLALELRGRLAFSVFQQSPNDVIIQGADGFLFYDQELDRGCAFPVEPAAMGESLQAWADYYREKGGLLIFALIPDKAMVYRDMLDELQLRRYSCVETKNNAFLRELERVRGAVILNYVPIMHEMRAEIAEPVYYHTDTHWKWAHTAHMLPRDIISALDPSIWTPEELQVRYTPERADLSFMAGITEHFDVPITEALRPQINPIVQEDSHAVPRRVLNSGGDLRFIEGRVLIVSDSFFNKSMQALEPYFADISQIRNTGFGEPAGWEAISESNVLIVEVVMRNSWELFNDYLTMDNLEAVKRYEAEP